MGRPVLTARRVRAAAQPYYATNRRQFVNWLILALEERGHTLPKYWNYGHLRRALSDALSPGDSR